MEKERALIELPEAAEQREPSFFVDGDPLDPNHSPEQGLLVRAEERIRAIELSRVRDTLAPRRKNELFGLDPDRSLTAQMREGNGLPYGEYENLSERMLNQGLDWGEKLGKVGFRAMDKAVYAPRRAKENAFELLDTARDKTAEFANQKAMDADEAALALQQTLDRAKKVNRFARVFEFAGKFSKSARKALHDARAAVKNNEAIEAGIVVLKVGGKVLRWVGEKAAPGDRTRPA